MFKLVRYSPIHFAALQNWVTDPDLLFRFAGSDFSFPLTIEQVTEYQQRNTDRCFYICLDGQDKPVAFGEIIPQHGNVPRLGRLLVGGAENRGKGIGASFIKLLVEECRRLYNSPSVELYVLDGNTQAIRCYEKCGFGFLPEQSRTMFYNGEQLVARKMAVSL